MMISITLLAFVAVVTIVNVWKSVKRNELKRKDLILNLFLTIIAAFAFALSWYKQSIDKKLADDQHTMDLENYARLESTYKKTIKIENITTYVNKSMDSVKRKSDSINANTIKLSDSLTKNFKISIKKQMSLINQMQRMMYPMPKEMFVDFELTFRYDSISNLYNKYISERKIIPFNLSNFNNQYDPEVNALTVYVLKKINRIQISPEFVNLHKSLDYADLYTEGEIIVDNPNKDSHVLILYNPPYFKIQVLNMPLKVSKNNNVPFISDLTGFRLYINNSLSEKMYWNGNQFRDSYRKKDGLKDVRFRSFFINFGNVMSDTQKPVNLSGVPVINEFKLSKN